MSFVSGGVTFFGSYRGPVDTSSRVPAVLIVGGTGAIDRNGDADTLATQAYSWIADLLAAQGVASLRYDKLGTGVTGLGPYAADPAQMLPLSYEQLRVQPARDALSLLAAQPGIDTKRLLMLGHSEGGAVSLVVATDPGNAPPLAGLMLVEPAYTHILDIVASQFETQMDGAVAGGAMTAADAATLKAWLEAGVSEIREGTPPFPAPGPVPLPDAQDFTQLMQSIIQSNIYGSDPAQMVVTHAYRTSYGKGYDVIAPEDLAPLISVPTLVTCGTKDFNTPCGDGSPGSGVLGLAAGFGHGTARTEVIPDMVHILRDVGSADVPDTHAQLSYPFSSVLEHTLTEFVEHYTSRESRR